MLRAITFLLLLALPNAVHSQDFNRTIISAAGDFDSANNLLLEWTLGEIAIGSPLGERAMVTEGFHQPMLSVSRISQASPPDKSDFNATVSPNPVKHELSIHIDDPLDRALQFRMTDMQGHLIKYLSFSSTPGEFIIDLTDYVSQMYILQFIDSSERTVLGIYKVAKIE